MSESDGIASSAVTVSESNESGTAQTFTSSSIDTSNEFFQSLGTNGRSCGSCHRQADNWTVTPGHLQALFSSTSGTDPIFRPIDGANSPTADVSTPAARQSAYSMLLTRGLIRIGLAIPSGAEFTLTAVDDPYQFASAAQLSLFRRPLPTTNLRFLSTVMWDARETFIDSSSTSCIAGTTTCFASISFDLADQANTATLGHAQAAQPLTAAQRQSIVGFELGLFTAQTSDNDAKVLTAKHGNGGPQPLSTMAFYFGINDVVSGDYQTHAAFDPVGFHVYDAWSGAPGGGTEAARAAVARGQALFNTRAITITGVKGLNDELQIASLQGTCTTCHDTPGAGNHSIPAPLDIGLTDASRRTADMPLYTLRRTSTGDTIQTTDPGRALITGRWKDIARFKGPILRALAGRGPYFHNGFAATLADAVDFYNTRFQIGFTAQDKSDLVAFLRVL